MGLEALFTIGLLYYYEDKVKNLRLAISDYQRALRLKSNSLNMTQHYTYLQLDNSQLRKQVLSVDMDNKVLQEQIRQLKAENIALRNAQPIQYESSQWAGIVNNVSPAEEIQIKPTSETYGILTEL